MLRHSERRESQRSGLEQPAALRLSSTAINDAGVVVGSLGGEAIRWEAGTMRALIRSWGPQEDYGATAISPAGVIAGYAGPYAAVWPSPTEQPHLVNAGAGELRPVGVSDNRNFVANFFSSTGAVLDVLFAPWSGGLPSIAVWYNGARKNRVRGMNAAGYIVGTARGMGMSVAVRWNPAHVHTILPTFGGLATGEAINSRGDIIGWSGIGATIWRLDGTFTTLSGLAAGSTIGGWSDAGRVVGNVEDGRAFTHINGTVTYLPLLDERNPTVVGVNTCGWIIGAGAGDTGYLWKRSGLTTGCDVPPPATVTP